MLYISSVLNVVFTSQNTLLMPPTQHEFVVVESVTVDAVTGVSVVTLKEPLKWFHSGQTVEEAGVYMDTRDTAALLTRNVELRGGDHPEYDRISGLTVRQQEYGFTVAALDRQMEPLQGTLIGCLEVLLGSL